MSLKWIGCLAALAASVGLAAHAAAGGAGSTPGAPVVAAPEQTFRPTMETQAGGPSLFDPHGAEESYVIRANADYLMWSLKRDHVPLLFGSLPPALAGTNPLPPGSIIPVFGGNHDSLDYGNQSGARFGVEGWLDAEQHFGLDADYFELRPNPLHAAAHSDPNGLPILGPTFNDPVANVQEILLFSEPGIRTSALALSSETHFRGFEADFRTRVPAIFNDRAELLVGFRGVQFDQNLDVSGSTIAIPGGPATLSVRYLDSFAVKDRFYGGQIGLDSESTYKWFFLNLKAKVAVGSMDETVTINGATSFLAPTTSVAPGGVLAQRSNINTYHHEFCTFAPEFTVNAGVLLGRFVRAYAGYNFLYIDALQRVGTTIDGVDATQVPVLNAVPNPNATRPAFQFSDGRFWAQGLNAGVEFRY